MSEILEQPRPPLTTAVKHFQNRHFWPLLAIIAAVGFALRCAQIDARPLHSDEGVNYHFLQEMLRTGYYPYSHENYHGPIFFWLLWISNLLLGDSILALRSTSIFFGTATIILPLLLRRQLGDPFVLIAALLVAVSPSLVFHSRYCIHETLFAFCCAGFALCALTSLQMKHAGKFYGACAFLAFAIATKETFVISLAAVSAALVISLPWYFFSCKVFGYLRSAWPVICRGYLIFVILLIANYSSGFREIKSLRELVLGIPQWVGRGTTKDIGHFKPTSYYLMDLLLPLEPYLPLAFALAVPAAAAALLYYGYERLFARYDVKLCCGVFIFAWTVLTFAVYSLVPYKTPWLVINFSLSATLFVAWGINQLWQAFMLPASDAAQPAPAARLQLLLGLTLLLMTLATALSSAVKYNYDHRSLPLLASVFDRTFPYGEHNPYSYVHTSPGMLEMIREIEEYWKLNPKARVLVATGHYWPLPYYLRHRAAQLGFLVTNQPERYMNEYDVIILNKDVPFDPPGWSKTYYRMSDVQEGNIFFRLESRPHSSFARMSSATSRPNE